MNNVFINYLKNIDRNKIISIYIDMDGVVVDYDLENHKLKGNDENVFLNKRPVLTTINILKEANNLENVELYILSAIRHNNQKQGKLIWLEKNMSFIKKENIHILSRENNNYAHPSIIKKEFLLKNINKNNINIHIDDDHLVLKELNKNIKDLKVLHPSSIID